MALVDALDEVKLCVVIDHDMSFEELMEHHPTKGFGKAVIARFYGPSAPKDLFIKKARVMYHLS